jgi:hypothetical protein
MNKEITDTVFLVDDYTRFIIVADGLSMPGDSSASIVHSIFKHIGLFTTKHIKKLRLISKPLEPVLNRHRIDQTKAAHVKMGSTGLFSRSSELGSIGIVLVPGLRSLFYNIHFLLNQYKPGFLDDDLWAYPYFHTFSKLRCTEFRSILISHT